MFVTRAAAGPWRTLLAHCTMAAFGLTAVDASLAAATPARAKAAILASMNGRNGQAPQSLILASDGNYYGTAYSGGKFGLGTAFRMTPDGRIEKLHDFSEASGSHPCGELMQAGDGALYGTATFYGPGGYGVVFRLSLDGKYKVLHAFNGTDGAAPGAGLIQARDGALYGTTMNGGDGGHGTVFRITTKGRLSSLASFADDEAALGSYPSGALLQADDGSFLGTTTGGGTQSDGTIFRVTSDGALTKLHDFSFDEGVGALGHLVYTVDHKYVVGAMYAGGANTAGTIYRFDGVNFDKLYDFNWSIGSWPMPPAVGTDGTTLYGFYATSTSGAGLYTVGPDGAVSLGIQFGAGAPAGAPTLSPSGSLIESTQMGGRSDNGAIFTVTPN